MWQLKSVSVLCHCTIAYCSLIIESLSFIKHYCGGGGDYCAPSSRIFHSGCQTLGATAHFPNELEEIHNYSYITVAIFGVLHEPSREQSDSQDVLI